MKRCGALRIACLLLFLSSMRQVDACGQEIREMQFNDQPITDILLALAKMAGRSIICDPTVGGRCSYYFAETDFDTALRDFLAANHLFVARKEGVYYVSRILIAYDRAKEVVSLRADGLEPEGIVRALSREIGTTILHDELPRESLAIEVSGLAPAALLEIVMKKYPDYTIEAGAGFFYIRRLKPAERQAAGRPRAGPLVTRRGERYDVDIDSARFRELVGELFAQAGLEYSLLVQADAALADLHFHDKSFEELLRLVLQQASADYAVEGGVYYLFDVQRRDILKQYRQTIYLPLVYLNAKELPGLLPPELAGANLLKFDAQTNTVILNGSREEVRPVEQFIRAMDRPVQEKRYYRFDLNHLKVDSALKSLPARYANLPLIVIPGTNSFVMLLSPEVKPEVERYVALIDQGSEGVPITLKFIRAQELVKNLPPSADKEDIVLTGDDRLLFFKGSEAKRREFLEELSSIDRPAPQIRYELLVVQYQRSEGFNWDLSLSNRASSDGGATSFLGGLSQLLSLNFDIVSTLGYTFALKLNLQLSDNTAQVLADTTLNGLSGQVLKFQNTDTYRYRDSQIDPDTGRPTYTGVTREITSGLILSIDGWASGDEMITMKVQATVSKTGAADTSGTGNPPPTSEKVVTTNLRTRSGRPVVIGGLIQQKVDQSVYKTPLLGDIPLLGALFRHIVESIDNTELVIYIVPHIEHPEPTPLDLGRRLSELYERFIAGREAVQ